MIKVSIIILTYNSAKHIRKCLKSIYYYYQQQIKDKEFEIIISDNDSTDQTQGLVKDFLSNNKQENIQFFVNKKNLGFAKGINQASKKAKGKYLLFLNPDTQFLDENLEKMIELSQRDQKITIVGGKILNQVGREELSAGNFYNLFNILLLAIGFESISKRRFSPHKICAVDFVSGGYLLIKKEIFESLKGFDEKYFMYIEDMDLCFRNSKRNLKTFFFPYATIEHCGQGSSNRSYAIENIYKGILYYFKKNKNMFEYLIVFSLLKLKAVIAVVIGHITRNDYLYNTYKKALYS